jgi:hypothetical protein
VLGYTQADVVEYSNGHRISCIPNSVAYEKEVLQNKPIIMVSGVVSV